MRSNSLLKQARIQRGWTRSQVVARVASRFSLASLERWESEKMRGMHEDNKSILCQLYDKSPAELGLEANSAIMKSSIIDIYAEEPLMTEPIRRALSNLGSQITSLIDSWPQREYHYEALQNQINRTIIQASHDSQYDSRQALKDVVLVPIQLCGGADLRVPPKKVNTHTLLKRLAASLAICWHLRRGKDLTFVQDLVPIYMAILQPLLSSRSDSYQSAATTLFSQCLRLNGSIVSGLTHPSSAMSYYQEALNYTLSNQTEQILTHRMIALSHLFTGKEKYAEALLHAEIAGQGVLDRNGEGRLMHSFVGSILALAQAKTGKMDDAMRNLTKAHDLFDPRVPPIPSALYTESNLLAITADVYQSAGNWKESIRYWEQCLRTADISALGMVQGRIQYATAEVSRDDQTRNMDLCITLCQEGITGARELHSKRYAAEASTLYHAIHLAWPGEDTVRQLGREYFSANT
jgi:tetratricopeptide (TPR) repeat protein